MRTVLVVLFSITLAVLLIILPFVSAASLLVDESFLPKHFENVDWANFFLQLDLEGVAEEERPAFSALFAKLVESSMPQFFDLIYGRADNLTLNYLEILPEFFALAQVNPEYGPVLAAIPSEEREAILTFLQENWNEEGGYELDPELEAMLSEESKEFMSSLQEVWKEQGLQEFGGDMEEFDPTAMVMLTADDPTIVDIRMAITLFRSAMVISLVLALAVIVLLLLIGRRGGVLGLAITTLVSCVIVAAVTELSGLILNWLLPHVAPLDSIIAPIAKGIVHRPRIFWIAYLAVSILAFVLRAVLRKHAQIAPAA